MGVDVEPDDDVALSRYLSWVLRHEPEAIGLQLDTAGWVALDELVRALAARGKTVTAARIVAVVRDSDKQRFALSQDGTRIRAQQGHSIDVELEHARATPPPTLYHGTVARFLASIRVDGLLRRDRHHVHLSPDAETARRVGTRRGEPIVLSIRAADMAAAGHVFYVTPNGVWLTDHVPPTYLIFEPEQEREST